MSYMLDIDKYESVYSAFKQFKDSLDVANAALEKAERIYNEECADLERKADGGLSENRHVEPQIKAYINIARAHTGQPVKAAAPLPVDTHKLARLSVQINNASANDRFAAQLYTEATGQLMSVSQAEIRISLECTEKKHLLYVKHEAYKKGIKGGIDRNIREAAEYMQSVEAKCFFSSLQEEKRIFGSNTEGRAISNIQYSISVGMAGLPLFVPDILKIGLAETAEGFYNSSTETIGIPVNLDLSEGTVIFAEYTNNNEHILINGLQNILLNIARYMSGEYSQIAFIDPIRFNNSSLGCLAPLTSGDSPLIDKVPVSSDEIREKIKGIIADLNEGTASRKEPPLNPGKRLFIFHNFPLAYDSVLVGQIQQLCANASYYGITVILTNNVSSGSTVSSDVVAFLKTNSVNINSDSDIFRIAVEGHGDAIPFEWYQAPSQLPQDIVGYAIKNKPETNRDNVYENRINIVNAPDYRKGIRQISNIPFGVDSEGNIATLDFENSNFATFICGAARSGKSTLLHSIITGIIKNTHPDDVEIWLIDFKMTEFSRYTHNMPPHVRYIILDESPELVYDIIDRLSEILTKRQNIFKGKWTKLGEVPPDKYMPVIFIIIDEFSVMSQIIADSLVMGRDNYSIKLQTLLAKGAALGLRFLFSSQGFTSGTRGLNDFSKNQIQQRIAMKTEYSEIKSTLDIMTASDADRTMMEQLPVHHALLRVPADEHGNHLLYTKVLHISDYSVQKDFINTISSGIAAFPKYAAADPAAFIDKKPLIIDGNNYFPFSARKTEMEGYVRDQSPALSDRDGHILFIGEPRRMMSLYPVEVTDSFCENLLLIAPAAEIMAASSVVMSIMESLRMQGEVAEFWAVKKHPVYRQVTVEGGTSVLAITSLDDICVKIKEIKGAIQQKKEGNTFYILLGFESFIVDMSYQQADSDSVFSDRSPAEKKALEVQFERRKENEPDILSLMAAMESGSGLSRQDVHAAQIQAEPNPAEGKQDIQDYMNAAYDARNDLKFILTQGPKLGYHFMMVFNTAGEAAQSKLDISLFKHKILFRIPKAEAATVVGSVGSGIITELEDRSFRYTDGLDSISFRPYLHQGLSWDGWRLSGDEAVNIVDEEEEYLL